MEDTNNNENIIERLTDNTSELSGDAKEIYNEILPIINDLIGSRKITADLFRPLLINLVRIIQDKTTEKYGKLDGSQKKQLALTVLDYIIKDLKHQQKIDSMVADAMLISLELLGPSIIDFASAFVKKVISVAEDIQDKGCKGCWSRNCRKKENPTK